MKADVKQQGVLVEHVVLSIAYFNDLEPVLSFAQQVNDYGVAGVASVREGVHVLPIIEDKVCVLRQYRYPINQWTYEFPGGTIKGCMLPKYVWIAFLS